MSSSCSRLDGPVDAQTAGFLEAVRRVIDEVLEPGRFFAVADLKFTVDHQAAQALPWEILKGRLLDRKQTTQERVFEAWNVYGVDESSHPERVPIVSVLLDQVLGNIHVTRSVDSYAWEGYDAGNNVVLSREVRKWIRELVGTCSLKQIQDLGDLKNELSLLLFHALIGCSRLPLTSIEAPHPAFSLGQLAYFPGSDADQLVELREAALRDEAAPARAPHPQPLSPKGRGDVMRSPGQLIERLACKMLSRLERTKLLEFLLRCTPAAEIPAVSERFLATWTSQGCSPAQFAELLRSVFNEVALSPYTDFAAKKLHLAALVLTPEENVDFLSYMLRHLVRHLTAYDLIVFHHRGANYPDVLLLDAALLQYLTLAVRYPRFFQEGDASRRRRRALRQAWLIRHFYDGLPVPEEPTSPGENARVMPAPHRRVPDEEILQPHKRARRLFADRPFPTELAGEIRALLRQSIADLHHPLELRELGMAVFLDRPFGQGKAPGEPDRTLLFSYEAFSRAVAERRLLFLREKLNLFHDQATYQTIRSALRVFGVKGISLEAGRRLARPGVVALEDANQAADDFVFLRTSRRSVREFRELFDFSPLAERLAFDFLEDDRKVLIMRGQTPASQVEVLVVYDDQIRRRLEFQVDLQDGYECRAGVEIPAAGLRVLRVWDGAEGGNLREVDLFSENLRLLP